MSAFLSLLYSQFFITPTYPTQSFDGQTIVVTGANVGLGLEAARHITRLNAAKVILAVRSSEKGETARKDIETTTGRQGVVEVWTLDLSSYDSVKDFVKKCNQLERLDCMLENAGMSTRQFKLAEENEATITTNVVSTFLLALLILPKLRESAKMYNTTPRLVIVSSEVHGFTKFPEQKSPNIFQTLNDKEAARMNDR
jgi:retinol dehydrogenase-12